jgi:exodeoxyribonuclease III
MKFISWNVNGIRSILNKGFLDFVQKEKPDVLCLQETKTGVDEIKVGLDSSYAEYWCRAAKRGYSGTAIFTKIKPRCVTYGLGISKHDDEGRVVCLEYENFFLVNVYTPNSKRELTRLAYRTKEWDVDFLKYVKGLEKIKPVVFCGDLNVAHKEIDLANPKTNRFNAGFTDEERAGFDNIIKAGFVDTFREFCPDPGQYSWWSYMNNARDRNIGWRIDYFCVSPHLRPRLKDASIRSEIKGSDHCPVTLVVD